MSVRRQLSESKTESFRVGPGLSAHPSYPQDRIDRPPEIEKICEILDALEADNQAANPGDDPLFEGGYLAAFRRLMTQVWDR